MFSDFKASISEKIIQVMIDGTFKSAPSGFCQLLTIHGRIFGKTFPIVYILLKNKTEELYCLAFLKLKELLKLNPKQCIMDFEKALKNSVSKCFPGCELHGCLFHYGQSLWRRI
jgi:hypothetical protein